MVAVDSLLAVVQPFWVGVQEVLQEVVLYPRVVALLQAGAWEMVVLLDEVVLLEEVVHQVVASFQGVGVVTFQEVACGELVVEL